MAIDKKTLEIHTDRYKFYLNDLNSRNIKGKHYDEIERLYNHILELGEQCSDINEFTTRIQDEKINENMSNAYSQALAENMNGTTSGYATGSNIVSNVSRGAMAVHGGQYTSIWGFITLALRGIPRLINHFKNRKK
ncbi:MAG: hypothetical protein J6S84_10965 [Bacteroidales bacterium]|jgi:DNA repair ATPase RecN|nr:hypothetical protein [Bacteroidales bacterium]